MAKRTGLAHAPTLFSLLLLMCFATHGKQAQHRAAPTPAPSSTAAGGIEEKMDPVPPTTDVAGAAAGQGGTGDELSALLKEFLLDSSSTFAEARIRATFYPSSRTRS
ncbi:uncharacterized protein [Aegilops tauschii subsp. strangulata]|uniref:uncharacterized protein n=1 Tax=Aegilops tauschii subsp. strangulata TaxID=200361 RepID=UPI001ABC2DF9|nr:uncharacterized protein LOC120966777 [Aegilops tauschii subsp. strangulata]